MNQALRLCEILIAWAVLLQSLELLLLSGQSGVLGIWRWKTLRREFGIFGPLLGWVLGDFAFKPLQLVRGIAAIAVLLGHVPEVSAGALLLLSLLTSMRFCGTFNGGSDCMSMVVLLGVAGARIAGSGPRATQVALGYIALQVALSYWVSGWVKIRESSWRSGRALGEFFALPQYGVPLALRQAFTLAPLAWTVGWGVMAAELGLPLLVWAGRPEVLLAGIAFHWVNAWVLGLNRFFWAWLATYPALVYFAGLSSPQSARIFGGFIH